MVHRSDQRALLTLKVTINPILWSKFQFFIGKKLGLSNNIKGNSSDEGNKSDSSLSNKFIFGKHSILDVELYDNVAENR